MRFYFLFILAVVSTDCLLAGGGGQPKQPKGASGLYVGMSAGLQMSGIKDEDFITRNYSPMLTIYSGKWFSPLLAIQIGYRGNYFNTISDDRKHFYKYFSGEAIFNLNTLVDPTSTQENWKICFHAGTGYFYNHDYNRSNICAHTGISGNFKITENISALLNVSAIMGWDIYQGDEDILPGTSIGLSYSF